MEAIDTGVLRLLPGQDGALFVMEGAGGLRAMVGGPVFEAGGQARGGFRFLAIAGREVLAPGLGEEWLLDYAAPGEPDLRLRVQLRTHPGSPFVRLRYDLRAEKPTPLSKTSGSDQLHYLDVTLSAGSAELLSEVRLSEFEPVLHSYLPGLETRSLTRLLPGESLPGPIVALHGARVGLLAAYEHGADHPQSFLHFIYAGGSRIELRARKGNYYAGQLLGPQQGWVSPWLELGLMSSELEGLLTRYRTFVLDEMNPRRAARLPLICYNTWNYQERNHLYHDRPYLESMNLERMLAEIDIAHRMGIDVFVIDTGWYDKTGDWQVNLKRFPDGLRKVKARLDSYGMQLGLWFNPLAAAVTSGIFREHPEYQMSWDGKLGDPWPVWETEASVAMCLASDFNKHVIAVMKRFRRELGVTYFKWDGIGQYGCNSGRHHHGGEANSFAERADCYAFQMGLHMIEIIERIAAEYPDVIVDFDATESGRFVGLGFLSAGRFFLINNGSYAKDFDTPESLGINPWMNMFFYPGAARPRVCRRGSSYDFILPSSLFLIHYLPDGPHKSLENNLASLVLGGNGIWGDLPALSAAELDFWQAGLADYKRVLPAAARVPARRRGFIGSSPEIYEKIDPQSASGLLAFFTANAAEVAHVTQPLARAPAAVKGADSWEVLPDGRVKVVVSLERDGARTVFFMP